MRIAVTGGGTGGHVYPALEVAKECRKKGWKVRYLGSFRGQEGRACQREDVPFEAYPSEPLYRLTSLRGMRGAVNLARASLRVRKSLDSDRPDVLFSTGGYSSAPVVAAARKLRIPYVVHEQNTIPGRTNRILSRDAFCVATTFRTGAEHFAGCRVERTGVPLRPEFRQNRQGVLGFAQTLPVDAPIVLVMGGSQGATALNDAALATAVRMARSHVQWLHVTGTAHFDGMTQTKRKLALSAHYELRAYLESEEMAAAIFSCMVAVSRSGAGTLSELAAFRRPAILVPYPQAFGDHQRHNALEFVEMGAASLVEQHELQPSTLEGRILLWQQDKDRTEHAQKALAEWDIPDSAERIVRLLEEAASH